MPLRNTLKQPLPPASDPSGLATLLSAIIRSIDGLIVKHQSQDPNVLDMTVSAYENTWSRAARRKRREAAHVNPAASDEVRMSCRIRCETEEAIECLVLDWVKGRDRSLFESFASHVERKVVDGIRNGIH